MTVSDEMCGPVLASPEELAVAQAVARALRRCIGRMLKTVGEQRLAGRRDVADLLDELATQIEHAHWLTQERDC